MKMYQDTKFKESVIVRAVVCMALLICAGCDTGSDTDVSENRLESLPPTELLKMAADELTEFKFLLSETAGKDSLSGSAADLVEIVGVLNVSESITQSGQAELITAVEKLKKACDTFSTSIESDASAAKMLKAASGISKDIKSVSKLIQ